MRRADPVRAFPLLLLPLLPACATPSLHLPDALRSADRHEVEGMRAIRTPERLTFGDYTAAEIQRSWTRGSGMGAAGMQRNTARQTFGYDFARAGESSVRVECEARAERRSVDLRVVTVDPGANVAVHCAGTDSDWRLDLAASRDRWPDGSVRSGAGSLRIEGVGSGGGVTARLAGFHMFEDDRMIGAVQVGPDPVVWLAPDLTAGTRDALAMAAVALVLYQEPDTGD